MVGRRHQVHVNPTTNYNCMSNITPSQSVVPLTDGKFLCIEKQPRSCHRTDNTKPDPAVLGMANRTNADVHCDTAGCLLSFVNVIETILSSPT